MDGIEAFKAIRKNARMQHIPIIALTASAMTSDRETILAHGFDGYLVKPIEEKVFFKTINEVLFGK
jgi:CheY-like chemotaxis protein